jgi:hypothetical protein
MKMEEEKLEAQMEYARYEHETEILRERKFYWTGISECLIYTHTPHLYLYSSHVCLGVLYDSAFNRNEYQESLWGG